jgi:potassium-transporting ATPase KdpC subunit
LTLPSEADNSTETLGGQARPAVLSVLLFTVLTGAIFPLALSGLARLAFPRQASGSLLEREGMVVGSELIGQNFIRDGYFDPRPSAAGNGYDAATSGGTNLSPSNPKLRDGETGSDHSAEPFAGVRQLAEAYRRRNGLALGAAVPIDAVTRSGSGLDPHISPANAELQVTRVARARRLTEDEVRRLIAEYTAGRQLGVLGEPRVNVLLLNFALDGIAPISAGR